MTESVSKPPSSDEKRIADAISRRDAPKNDILTMIRELPSTAHFVMKDTWIDLSRDEALEPWRRLESYKLLVHHCVTYPCDLDDFVSTAIAPLAAKELIRDMTRAQQLPLNRKEGRTIYMAPLPIPVYVGFAAIYFGVRSPENAVEQAAVYPDSVEAGAD